jgi:hypothetical protein
MRGLSRLCEELHIRELAERLSHVRECEDFEEDVTQKDLETRKGLSVLEERMQQGDCEIMALWTELSRPSRVQESSSEAVFGRVSRLEADVSALQTASALLPATPPSGWVSITVFNVVMLHDRWSHFLIPNMAMKRRAIQSLRIWPRLP